MVRASVTNFGEGIRYTSVVTDLSVTIGGSTRSRGLVKVCLHHTDLGASLVLISLKLVTVLTIHVAFLANTLVKVVCDWSLEVSVSEPDIGAMISTLKQMHYKSRILGAKSCAQKLCA